MWGAHKGIFDNWTCHAMLAFNQRLGICYGKSFDTLSPKCNCCALHVLEKRKIKKGMGRERGIHPQSDSSSHWLGNVHPQPERSHTLTGGGKSEGNVQSWSSRSVRVACRSRLTSHVVMVLNCTVTDTAGDLLFKSHHI